MEKQGTPVNTFPQTTEANPQHQAQPPVYHDPNHVQQQPQQYQGSPAPYQDPNMANSQGQVYQQPAQYAGSPPPMQQGSPAPYYQQQGTPQPQLQHAGTPGTPGTTDPTKSATGLQEKQYRSATAIPALGRGASPVDCPACGQRAMTNVSYEIGNSTHAWALALCCLVCLGCIPYLMNSLKDVQHKCSKCGVLLATWHRSGSTEVHFHG